MSVSTARNSSEFHRKNIDSLPSLSEPTTKDRNEVNNEINDREIIDPSWLGLCGVEERSPLTLEEELWRENAALRARIKELESALEKKNLEEMAADVSGDVEDKPVSFVKRENIRRYASTLPSVEENLSERGSALASENGNLPTKLPEKAPIKWGEIKDGIFDFSKVTDEYLLQRMDEDKERCEKILSARKNGDAKLFIKLVWQDYLDAGILTKSALRGNSRKGIVGLDKTLFDLLYAQCSEVEFDGLLLGSRKTKQQQNRIGIEIDEKLDQLRALGITSQELYQLALAARREGKSHNLAM